MLGACVFRYNSPGCFLWAEVRPNGRVFVVDEFKFKQKSEAEVAEAVLKRSAELFGRRRLDAVYAPPEMFPEVSETVREAESPSEVFARNGLTMFPCGSNELHGWQRVHDYLRNAPDGDPWLIISPDCRALIRTLPSLVQKKTDADDVDGESFAAHALRVLLSARPSPSALQTQKPPYAEGTIGWLRQQGKKPAPTGPLARPRVSILG